MGHPAFCAPRGRRAEAPCALAIRLGAGETGILEDDRHLLARFLRHGLKLAALILGGLFEGGDAQVKSDAA